MRSSLMVDLIRACRSLSSSPPDLGSDVIHYALYEHETYTKAFDGLDTKASGIVYFVAIVLGLTAFQSCATNTVGWVRIASLVAFTVALILAIGAWWVRGAEGLPKASAVLSRLRDLGLKDTEEELVGRITESSDTMRRLCLAKSQYLAWSFGLLLVGVVLLIVSLRVN